MGSRRITNALIFACLTVSVVLLGANFGIWKMSPETYKVTTDLVAVLIGLVMGSMARDRLLKKD